jgi:hypothetical protein
MAASNPFTPAKVAEMTFGDVASVVIGGTFSDLAPEVRTSITERLVTVAPRQSFPQSGSARLPAAKSALLTFAPYVSSARMLAALAGYNMDTTYLRHVSHHSEGSRYLANYADRVTDAREATRTGQAGPKPVEPVSPADLIAALAARAA